MSERSLVHLLGLCSVAAGALLVCAPSGALALDGVTSDAGRLFTRSLAVVFLAVGIGGWATPPGAVRAYLWVFGVGLKGAGALLWGATALATGAGTVGAGAALDAALALFIAAHLIRR